MSVSSPAVAGGTISAVIPTPPGPPAGLGARIETPLVAAIATAFGYASIGTDFTTILLEAPVLPGAYLIHWMTSGAQSTYDAYQPLIVVSPNDAILPGLEYPVIDPAQIRPEVDDIALLELGRTIDKDTGEEVGSFTGNTRPTAAQVERLIDKAVDDIRSELTQQSIDVNRYPQVRRAVEFYTAMLIEGGFFREEQSTGGTATAGVWQAEYQEAVKDVNAGIVMDMAQNNLLGGLEPRLA